MKKKIVSALLTATMVCGMSVVPAVEMCIRDRYYYGIFSEKCRSV